MLPTLYSRSSTGKVLEWKIETEGPKYRTHTGQQGGSIVTSEWSLCVAKNAGRGNATSAEEQASLEAKALWKKKIKSHGYWEDVADIDKETFIEPMLAKKFHEHKKKVAYPVMVDRKYNGMRQVTQIKGVFTQKGEVIHTAPHIWEVLKPLFVEHPNLVLDGELYNHEYRFKLNELISIVRRSVNFTAEDLVKSKQIVKYYVYDGYGFKNVTKDSNCSLRRESLKVLLKGIPYIEVVPYEWANNEEEITKLYDAYVQDGYEGAIVRMNMGYENKRTDRLLKVKPTDDAEFEIIDLLEGTGNWSGAAKICVLNDGDGSTFRASVKGSYENAAVMLKNKKDWVGKTVTIFYNGLTGLGTPNFAQLDPNNCFKGDR